MEHYVQIDQGKLYIGSTMGLGANAETEPDLEVVDIFPESNLIKIKLLSSKVSGGPPGTEIVLTIGLFGDSAKIVEDIGDTNPNTLFKAKNNI